jgi:hypothetical protein
MNDTPGVERPARSKQNVGVWSREQEKLMKTLEKVPEDTATQVVPTPPSDRILRLINPFVRLLLRSPLHVMASDTLLLLTYTGRKTGKRYTIPVGYSREGDVITVFTSHGWWKNLQGGASVQLEIKGVRRHGTTEAICADVPTIAAELHALMCRNPSMAKAFRMPLDSNGQPDAEIVRQLAQHEVMVRIQLAPSIAR